MTSKFRSNTAAPISSWGGPGGQRWAPERRRPGRRSLVLDREAGRRRRQFDAEVVLERGLIILEIEADEIFVQAGIDPVQPDLVARLDRKGVGLRFPRIGRHLVLVGRLLHLVLGGR